MQLIHDKCAHPLIGTGELTLGRVVRSTLVNPTDATAYGHIKGFHIGPNNELFLLIRFADGTTMPYDPADLELIPL